MGLPTFSDLFRIARDEVLTRNARISRDAVEREGTDANVLVAAAVAAADEVVGQLTIVEAGLFLDSAEADALDRLVFDRYGLTRKPAAPALGTVTFSIQDGSPNPSSFTIPLGTLLSTSDGIQFTTTQAVVFPAAALSVDVDVQSTLAGLTQQAKAETITSIVSTIAGAPTSPPLVVINPLATVGADDEEADDSLRERARNFFTTARRGTIAAIKNAALGIPGVRTAAVFEATDDQGRPARYVTLVISDAFTASLINVDPTPPVYETQAQTLATLVYSELSDVRAAGIFVRVIVAIVVLQPIQLQLSFVAGSDVDQAALEARAAAVNYVNALEPGETLVVTDMLDVVRAVTGIDPTGTGVFSPAGNVVSGPLQVIRTGLDFVAAATPQSAQNLTGAFVVLA